MGLLGAGIDVLVVGAGGYVDDAATSLGHSVDGRLDGGVVATAVGVYIEHGDGSTGIGSGHLLITAKAKPAQVGELAGVVDTVGLGVGGLLGGDRVAIDAQFVDTRSLALGHRVDGLPVVGRRLHLVGRVHSAVAVPHTPSQRHIAGVDHVLHKVALVAEEGPTLLLLL